MVVSPTPFALPASRPSRLGTPGWLPEFLETTVERTQEYVLRWSADSGHQFREVVRQQRNFSPGGILPRTVPPLRRPEVRARLAAREASA